MRHIAFFYVLNLVSLQLSGVVACCCDKQQQHKVGHACSASRNKGTNFAEHELQAAM
jgi:hypothetical protein